MENAWARLKTLRMDEDFEGGVSRSTAVRLLGTARTISMFGSAISEFAIPTMAVLLLGATPLQIGWLKASETAAFPLLGLIAGVWVDRLPRRSVMIAADLGRALALLVLPLLLAVKALTFVYLLTVVVVIGIGDVFFIVAYQAYLPLVVLRADLREANSRLEMSIAGAQLIGKSLAGSLIQFVGMGWTIALDAVSFLASAGALHCAPAAHEERRTATAPVRVGFRNELVEGVRFVWRVPTLRSLLISASLLNLGYGIIASLLLVYAYRDLHLAPPALALVLAFGNLGFLGAMRADTITKRWGVGNTIIGCFLLVSLTTFALPLARIGAPLVVILAARVVASFTGTVAAVVQVSLRQALVPHEFQGRTHAFTRSVVMGAMPVGALAGGWLAGTSGIIDALLIAGSLQLAGAAILALSRVRTLQDAPHEAA